MVKFQQGKYIPINPEKYVGNKKEICFRSSWERKAFKFMDMNPSIKKWNSEGSVVKYLCPTDNRYHRYFVDLTFQTTEDKIYMIEIKPLKETRPPRKSKNKERYLKETFTYMKNQAKWDAAQSLCESKGWIFKVWTEKELKALGLKL